MATKNSIDSNIPIEIAKGGTNAASMATNTGIVKYDGTSLVTSSTALIDSSNRYTNTSQPAFSARASAQNDVTGDGTTYTIIFANEIFDQGNNFDGTSTFTAPVTGKYQFNVHFSLTGIVAGMTGLDAYITTSKRTYYVLHSDVVSFSQGASCRFTSSVLADMDAGDTCVAKLQVSGGSKVIDIEAVSYFQGFLVC